VTTDIAAAAKRLRGSAAAGLLDAQATREVQLRQLRRLLVEQSDRLTAALATDLGKPATEAWAMEIGFTIGEIDHALSRLGRWMRPQKVRVPLTYRPGRARVVRQPLGTVLVISPWNYPVQLLLGPMVGALAAGNTVVLKPSELAPATSAAMAELIPAYLDERAVAVIEGGVAETTELLAEPFDHIVYTGGGAVAKVVMRAAAEHLTPVTLELGGKSPAIVAGDADIDVAARRIAWGRFTNAGQTCIAPDYVLVAAEAENRLLDALRRAVIALYGEDPQGSDDYGRIVNERHVDRLRGLLDAGGFESVVVGGTSDRTRRYVAPTILAGVDSSAAVMQEEIFGPILPVIAVDDVDSAVRFVSDRPHPLALYVFTGEPETADRIVARTRSGGVGVNLTLLQAGVAELPFGGVGPSGTGAYHGEAGFERFSHRRSVLTKPTWLDPSVLYPPYTRWKRTVLRRVL
jgi:aldehyde dehydrogenase (NAD+)